MDKPEIMPFHTYLWKIASRCNINCTYCYIYNLADSRWRDQPAFMSEDVARQTALRMREHCEANNKKDMAIIFHGGEPLLGGVSHLSMLVSVIREILPDYKISMGMQSNGLLFTEEIGDFFQSNRIAYGISSDGPPEVNDLHRLDHAGKPTSKALEEKIKLVTSRYMLMASREVLRESEKRLYYSPWRDDARTIFGLFHACHVFSQVEEFYSRAERSPVFEDYTEYIAVRRFELLQQLRLGLQQLRKDELPEPGREIYDFMVGQVELHEKEKRLLNQNPSPNIVDHLDKWCQRYPELVDSVLLPVDLQLPSRDSASERV